jgi:hypothetical protein
MIKNIKEIEFGNFGKIYITFDFDGICDTEVSIEGSHLCTISSTNIDEFTKDFKELIERYFI